MNNAPIALSGRALGSTLGTARALRSSASAHEVLRSMHEAQGSMPQALSGPERSGWSGG
jgi:hypothetical protein